MSLSSDVQEPIDDLVLTNEDKDKSAQELVPALEYDPILIGLVKFTRELRQQAAAGTSGGQSSSPHPQLRR